MPDALQQHRSIQQALYDHAPDVLLVSQLSTAQDAAALRLAAQHGVAIVAAAPAATLQQLLQDPDLNPLLGGLQPAAGSAADCGNVQQGDCGRSVLHGMQRRGPPLFDGVVEVLGGGAVRLHPDTAHSVDRLLAPPARSSGSAVPPAALTQLRVRSASKVLVQFESLDSATRARSGSS